MCTTEQGSLVEHEPARVPVMIGRNDWRRLLAWSIVLLGIVSFNVVERPGPGETMTVITTRRRTTSPERRP